MIILVATLSLVGILCAFNLLLAFGVIRRLREHGASIDRLFAERGLEGHSLPNLPSVGDRVPEFSAQTVDGEHVSDILLRDASVIFLSAECDSCIEQLPEMAKWAMSQDRARTFVVVNGAGGAVASVARTLSPVAQVVSDSNDMRVSIAFRVIRFPAFCVIDSAGRIATVSEDLRQLFEGSRP